MAKQRITTGSILKISIEDQYFAFAQILEKGKGIAFFNYKSIIPLGNLDELLHADILFILAVYDNVITSGHWEKIGKLPIRQDLTVLPMKFIQDAIHPDRFELYNPTTGEITPTTKEHCKGLERCAIWDSLHVEDRIRDYYKGVPCIWLKMI